MILLERLHRGGAYQRDGSSLTVRERRWFLGNLIEWRQDILRK